MTFSGVFFEYIIKYLFKKRYNNIQNWKDITNVLGGKILFKAHQTHSCSIKRKHNKENNKTLQLNPGFFYLLASPS